MTNEVQNNQLERLRIDQRLQQLTENGGHTQYSTPNTALIASGLRYLCGKMVKEIYGFWMQTLNQWTTNQYGIGHRARWSPDGRTLFFSSDRTGIYNIFAIDLETEILYQVTNVLTVPLPKHSPKANTSVYRYHHWGYGLATMPLQRDQWWELE